LRPKEEASDFHPRGSIKTSRLLEANAVGDFLSFYGGCPGNDGAH
jgi:hypothetical protein